jgi:hypothetical protein
LSDSSSLADAELPAAFWPPESVTALVLRELRGAVGWGSPGRLLRLVLVLLAVLSLLCEHGQAPELLTLLPSLRVQAPSSRLCLLLRAALVVPDAGEAGETLSNPVLVACCCR